MPDKDLIKVEQGRMEGSFQTPGNTQDILGVEEFKTIYLSQLATVDSLIALLAFHINGGREESLHCSVHTIHWVLYRHIIYSLLQ